MKIPGRALLVLCLSLLPGALPAQERFSIFVPSEQENVERMLKLAGLRDDDVVVDLGSGDGRVVLTAAKLNPRLRGWGVDIDEKLVAASNAAAEAQGVSDRVHFLHQNAFDADLREATVIAMWFWPEMQRMMRPVILSQVRPGTRIVTNLWDMGSWQPDVADNNGPTVNLWIVPARVEGYWSWELPVGGRKVTYGTVKEQRFQAVEGVIRAGSRREVLNDMKLRGEDISFKIGMTLDGIGYVRHEFRGKVRGDAIEGTASLSLPPHDRQPVVVPWRAARTATSIYFEPTGVDAR
jgi:SAM-dependent methyltransferase